MKRGINLGVVLLGVSFIGLMFVGVLISSGSLGNNVDDITDSNDITGDVIMISTENAIIIPGMDADLQSKEEGTIMWWTKPEMRVFKDFESTKEYLIMFSSSNLPGLMIAYGFAGKNIVGGMPMMKSGGVEFLDNKAHQIAYTFKKGGEQVLYFDGEMKVRGEYRESQVNVLTGHVVVGEMDIAKESIVDRVATVDRVMTQEEIKLLMK